MACGCQIGGSGVGGSVRALETQQVLTAPLEPQENSEDDKKRGRSTDSEVSQVGVLGVGR